LLTIVAYAMVFPVKTISPIGNQVPLVAVASKYIIWDRNQEFFSRWGWHSSLFSGPG